MNRAIEKSEPADFRDPQLGRYVNGVFMSYYEMAKDEVLTSTDNHVDQFNAMYSGVADIGSRQWIQNSIAMAMLQDAELVEIAEREWRKDQ